MEQQQALPGIPTAAQAPPPLNWLDGIPVLDSPLVFLREVEASDATALAEMFENQEVARYLPRGPSSVEGFEDFIEWAIRTRQAGRYISLVAVPTGGGAPVGLFQIWPLQPDFAVAEWGFAIARPHWGTGLFVECARLVVDFAFSTLGVVRLEARSAADDRRSTAALEKFGATREMVMRKCFPCWNGDYQDHVMWSIMADAVPEELTHQDGGGWALTPVRSCRSLDPAFQPSLFARMPATQRH